MSAASQHTTLNLAWVKFAARPSIPSCPLSCIYAYNPVKEAPIHCLTERTLLMAVLPSPLVGHPLCLCHLELGTDAAAHGPAASGGAAACVLCCCVGAP